MDGTDDMDRISNLPDSLLLHILSFLPAKDAVRTALIARRFRHLWQFLRTLSFDFCSYHDCETKTYEDGPEYNENFLDVVYSMLLLHQGNTIDKFHLNLELNYSHTMDEGACRNPDHEEFVVKEKRMADAVTTWIISAMRKNVEVLHLDFIGCGLPEINASYTVPAVVFSRAECLRELKLAACEIKPTAQIQLRSLKKLWLNEVDLNDNTMDQILCGCSVLEELSVLDCNGLSRLALRNPSIKSLVVSMWYGSQKLKICCPYIVSLDVSGKIENVDLVDVSSVACASLFCHNCFKCEPSSFLKMKTHFEKLRHCKIFRPCVWCIMIFNTLQLADLFFECKYLELKFLQMKLHRPGISYILRHSPFLETLDMYICSKWPDTEHDKEHLLEAQYLDNRGIWSSKKVTFHCLEHYLRTVRIYGDISEPDVIEFIQFLLKNAMVLEKLVISTEKTFQPTKKQRVFTRTTAHQNAALSIEKRFEICQKLCGLPRASRYAMILFS